jgi:hypothetical protein
VRDHNFWLVGNSDFNRDRLDRLVQLREPGQLGFLFADDYRGWLSAGNRHMSREVRGMTDRARALFKIPDMKLASKLNDRVHWRVKAKQAKTERQAAFYSVPKHPVPCMVTITRIGPATLDNDNLAGACKSIRDGIADRLGIDDRSPAVVWRYAQRKHGKGVYGVEIEFAPVPREVSVQCVQSSLLESLSPF